MANEENLSTRICQDCQKAFAIVIREHDGKFVCVACDNPKDPA